MLLQPKNPGAKPSPNEDARRRSVSARFRAAVEENGVRDHITTLCSQAAELEQLVAALPEPDQRLTDLVGQLSETVATLAKIPWDTCR